MNRIRSNSGSVLWQSAWKITVISSFARGPFSPCRIRFALWRARARVCVPFVLTSHNKRTSKGRKDTMTTRSDTRREVRRTNERETHTHTHTHAARFNMRATDTRDHYFQISVGISARLVDVRGCVTLVSMLYLLAEWSKSVCRFVRELSVKLVKFNFGFSTSSPRGASTRRNGVGNDKWRRVWTQITRTPWASTRNQIIFLNVPSIPREVVI